MLRILEWITVGLPFALLAVLLFVLGHALLDQLSWDYLTSAPRDQGRSGGLGPIVTNTVLIVGAGLVLAIPTALASAIAYILATASEGRRAKRLAGFYRKTMEVAVSVPRLLWGLAGSVVVGGVLGFGISATTGIATLAFLLVPILFTGFIEGLCQAQKDYGATLDALGVSPVVAIARVLVPAALPSLGVAILLATGRAMGDAAALYLTAGLSDRLLTGLTDPASTLAVSIYVLAVEIGGGTAAALSAAGVLLVLTAFLVLPVFWLKRRI